MSLTLKSREELHPVYGSRKSFYGKARVLKFSDGAVFLQSYDALMCKLEDGRLVFTPEGAGSWSYTTGRHLKEFSLQYGGDYSTKSDMYDAPKMSWEDAKVYYEARRKWS